MVFEKALDGPETFENSFSVIQSINTQPDQTMILNIQGASDISPAIRDARLTLLPGRWPLDGNRISFHQG